MLAETGRTAAPVPTGLLSGPASAGQRAVWLATRLDPGSAAWHIPVGLRWPGRADPVLLGRCLTEIARVHAVLRTGFALRGDSLVQRVLDPAPLTVPVVGVPPGGDVALARRAAAAAPFDLAAGPLVRAEVIRGPEHDDVVLTTHHIASDGWSTAILVRALRASYLAGARGEPVALPEPPLRFIDHAVWEHRHAAAGGFAADLAHWRRALAGAGPDTAVLPTTGERPPGGRPAGRLTRVDLPAGLAGDLRAFAAAQGATLFMAAVAAFGVLLGRHTGADDVTVGTAVSGRDHPGTAEVAGFFVNTVVLRVDLRGRPGFTELLARVRAVCAAAYDHQRVPFPLVAEHVGRAPLYRAFLTHQSAALLGGAGGAVEDLPVVDVPLGEAALDFALTLDDSGPAPHLLLEHATDLITAGAADRLAAHYVRLLTHVLAEPHTPVHAIPLAAPPPVTAPRPAAATLPAALRRTVSAHPAGIAAVCDGEETTFAELAARADALAAELAGRGFGEEDVVAVCLPRGTELLVALLGVLWSGAAYLPLDPGYPAERLRLVLADAGAGAVVTTPALRERLPIGPGVAVLLAGGGVPVGGVPGDGPVTRVRPDSLAYVVHTSGSTGRPRGAMITHRALAEYCASAADRFGLTRADRVLQFASIGFDVAVEEIWPTWLRGGAVVSLPGGPLRAPAEFTALLAGERVTVVELPTAYWHEWTAWLDRTGTALPPALRLVIVGGERVLPERLAAWHRTGVDLAHVYGLTETTVTSTVHGPGPIAGVQEDRANLPVGTPLPCAEVLLLDRWLDPVPPGATGEVHLGGPTVARGYVGRPDLTADRFVPHPAAPGQRLYRTGDLARVDERGALVFLGRTDEQVKIRGFRVEPAEVAVVLAEHPLVGSAVVVPVRGALVGYVVAAGAHAPEPAALVSFQRTRLPDHMVAGTVVVLPELPVNAHGKVDRSRLPAPTVTPGAAGTDTEDQRLLAVVWAEVLGHRGFGRHDDFFQLGGDSIAAIRLVARAAELGLRFTPRQVFEHRTIARLADVATPAGTPVDQGPVVGTAPLTPIQRWLVNRGHTGFLVPVELDLADGVTAGHVRAALAALVEHHDALRTRFTADRQHVPPPGAEVPLTVAGQDHRAAVAASVDPVAGRPLAALYRPGRLFLVVHHLVLDAVSLRIVLEDLATALTAARDGRDPVLPAKTSSFLDWSTALATRPGTTRAEVAYWRSVVEGPVTPLPRDAEGANTESSARTLDTYLAVSAPPRVTDADLLLGALAGTLTAWAGPTVVELEGHGRADLADLDVSRTVGWFTCAYPLRLPSSGDDVERLRAVRAALRGVPRSGIGYGLLVHGTDRQLPGLAPEVSVNLLGRWGGGQVGEDAPVRPGDETGAWRPDTGERPHLLEINAAGTGAGLRISWTYSTAVHHPDTVERLAADLVRRATALAAATDVLVPADFPLAALSRERLADVVAGTGAAGPEAVLPPTAAQAAQLRLTEVVADPAAHVMHTAHALPPDVDPARLRQAWEAVVAARSALRSGFRHGVQVVHRHAPPGWSEAVAGHAWADLSPARRAAVLEQVFDEHEELAGDLTGPGLSRVRLLRFADHPVLVWSYHHLLLDGWSDGLVLADLARAYLSAADPVSDTGDREFFAGRATAAAPVGAPTGSGPRGWHRVVADATPLAAAARRAGVTPGTIVHAAWARVVGERLGRAEVDVGVSVTGRAEPVRGVEELVGAFARVVPVRLPVPGPLTAVQDALAGAQDGPPLLPGWAEGDPLAHTVFAYENFPAAGGAAGGLALTHLHSRQERLWPLMVMAIPDEGGLAVVATHDTGRVPAAVVHDLVADYLTALGELTGEEPT